MKNKQAAATIPFPIGSIVCYAGDLADTAKKDALIAMGWLICDGQSYANTAYPLLYDAIKNANGGNEDHFNVPNLKSRFLRGTAGDEAGRDPQAAERLEAAPNGAKGNNTGSLEMSATALPGNNWKLSNAGAHTHTIAHLGGDSKRFWKDGSHSATKDEKITDTSKDGVHSHTISGFDEKSVPINIALYYIIKAAEISTGGTAPIGGIVAFCGEKSPDVDGWLKCDGGSPNVKTYSDLRNTIGTNFGGTDSGFNVPDLRGYFLRGTNYGAGRDPGTENREPLMPGGNINDNIGSLQLFSTRKPANLKVDDAGVHTHTLPSVPKDKQHLGDWASGVASTDAYKWTDNTTTSSSNGDHSHSVIGGDQETRPENIYADFFISANSLPASAPPIGSIMAFGGDTENPIIRRMLDNTGWHLCDGSKLEISSYEVLHNLIGDLYGKVFMKSPYSEPKATPYFFLLPDLRGRFILGAGAIKIATVLSDSTTGKPVKQILTSSDGAHIHTMADVPSDKVSLNDVHWLWEADAALSNSDASTTSANGLHTHPISGGDSESRPTNVYVNFIIRII